MGVIAVLARMDDETNKMAVMQAARWYARLQAADCTENERQAFRDWLARDDAHAHAYAATERVANGVSQRLTADPRLRALAGAALESQRPARARWGWAAALIVSIGLGASAVSRFDAPTAQVGTEAYANSSRQQQTIQLPDGSTVHLDVGSRIDVQLSKAERRIELLGGRAYFEVAHDASRPFSVSARGARTTALGTRFQVALLDQAVSITLLQGSVAVADTGNGAQWREMLAPGEQLNFDVSTRARERRIVDIEVTTGWLQGRLIFKDTPLSEALAEVNRYAAVKLRLGDASLGSIAIGGNFAAGSDSEGLVNALVAVLPVKSVRTGADEIVLFPRYETEAQR